MQAAQLRQALGATGAVSVTFVATDSRLPTWIQVVSRVRFVRTVVRLVFFVPRLAWKDTDGLNLNKGPAGRHKGLSRKFERDQIAIARRRA